jgi:hypothetical protein
VLKYPTYENNCFWCIPNSENTIHQQDKCQWFHNVLHVLVTTLNSTGEKTGFPNSQLWNILLVLICSLWRSYQRHTLIIRSHRQNTVKCKLCLILWVNILVINLTQNAATLKCGFVLKEYVCNLQHLPFRKVSLYVNHQCRDEYYLLYIYIYYKLQIYYGLVVTH